MNLGIHPRPDRAKTNGRCDWLPLALVFLTILFVGYVRWRIADTPLERDEGEYAYGGQLILHGDAPYKYLYNIKLPGTYAAYAVIMAVFGETPIGIHYGLLIVNAASILLLYQIGRKISGSTAGVLAAVFFAFLTLDPSLHGFAAQATHFVALAALAGIYLLLRALDSKSRVEVLLAGLCMGASFILKQPGITFGFMGFIFVMWLARKHANPNLRVLYGAGWLAPYLLTCIALWIMGSFTTFWIWTTTYAASHRAPLSSVWQSLKLLWSVSPVWIQVIAFLCLGATIYIFRTQRLPLWKRVFLIGFLASGAAAVVPGFTFFRHYFIMPAPAAALVIAVALVDICDIPKARVARFIPIAVCTVWTGAVIYCLNYYFFFDGPDVIIGRRYKGNPFLQTRVIGDYLAQRCSPNGRIAVLQSEPEILFYARRKSATGFIYAYDITGLSDYRKEMEEQFKREVTESNPEYVVFVLCPYSWTLLDRSGMSFADWCWRFPKNNNYTRVAVADNLDTSLENTVFKFDAAAAHYTNQFPTFIEVYRRYSAP